MVHPLPEGHVPYRGLRRAGSPGPDVTTQRTSTMVSPVLEWDQLRYMLAVHRGGSMQAAAAELRVDRATVVRRLDALEAALGARLFERRRDGCTLTPAGLEIIETVRGIEQATTSL